MSIPTRQASLKELADVIGAKIHGDPETFISGIATLEHAGPGDLSFFSNRKYHKYLLETQASIVILHPDDLSNCPSSAILFNDPYLAYAKIATWLTKPKTQQVEIAANAVLEDNVTLGENISIGAHVVIGTGSKIGDNVRLHAGCSIADNVTIADSTILYPNVSIYSNVSIGKQCIIHSGAVIGSDGFGIANEQGDWFKVPQLGHVVVGDNVEVGANTTIDRGAIEDTIIENGVKLDNLIQIAHNVRIGENTAIAGCVGIAGSSTIGKYCAIGGGAGILGHLNIADHVHITATSLVTKSITEAGVYSSGTPLQENAQWHKNFIRFKQLDKMARRLSELEKRNNL
ncbi:MAG: UDP-3-O-(3-hydroxymyristoyl)glucosamine N-acyltransferase [gamma proteobacterium symbiont of Bathyaustriella thionipta]|nr:UDP-3-O-(3-hydroxymyristoyl)glucosamine N-acyltransferase [gamma proteobacterium symbiont of Bathyaustriella thionipta]MCU7948577.1 UDP-3-O-(3-hydroxymyristoyl)glucosamine N-acyltransferase [gamma proteobacterium symbiont of Bathyaustriella thionipta]MCU7953302.1 UDP-3-O-(3-hydroxymyristoyl)glucosamine N-acyltransferase [gamma proteobacterium symbiont of Bathyaustriella thionipta]MCU7955083.1 UDP-3-O-(3-hydroxymyristoyl)glucosamine N-acyltransferase [gamma proteobacterium symbiont of Bathyaus